MNIENISKLIKNNFLTFGSLYFTLISYLLLDSYYSEFSIDITRYLEINEFVLYGLYALSGMASIIFISILLVLIVLVFYVTIQFIMEFIKFADERLILATYKRKYSKILRIFRRKPIEDRSVSQLIDDTITKIKTFSIFELSRNKSLIIFFISIISFGVCFYKCFDKNSSSAFLVIAFTSLVSSFFALHYLLNRETKKALVFSLLVILVGFPGLIIHIRTNEAETYKNSKNYSSVTLTTLKDTIHADTISNRKYLGKTKNYHFFYEKNVTTDTIVNVIIIPSSKVLKVEQTHIVSEAWSYRDIFNLDKFLFKDLINLKDSSNSSS